MKRRLVVFAFALLVSATIPASVSASNIRLWPSKHHKSSSAEGTTEPKPKTKKTLLHRSKAPREESAASEATYGMTAPKSVGWAHPMPGPAGYGAK